MNILVLGGTGTMGQPLVSLLASTNDVYVTTRQDVVSSEKITYIKGNAKDIAFLTSTLQTRHWDAIVDFMVWTSDFPTVLPLMLDNTDQYVFISSARVYAQSDEPITEDTPRLLDVSTDKAYLATNEYALAKAREEDMLFQSGRSNFTIVRPTITYNTQRLQLGVFEKEMWLYRALHGRSIVFSEDIADKVTTMTHGNDVATGIASLIGQKDALGEVFHITCPKSLLWREVFDIYLSVLEKRLGHRPRVVMTKKSTNLQFKERIYQVIYCRYFNRTFDNSKIAHYCDVESFTSPQVGLTQCLEQLLKNPVFKKIDWFTEAVNDRASKERTPLSEIPTTTDKVYYIIYRYNLKFLLPLITLSKKLV